MRPLSSRRGLLPSPFSAGTCRQEAGGRAAVLALHLMGGERQTKGLRAGHGADGGDEQDEEDS